MTSRREIPASERPAHPASERRRVLIVSPAFPPLSTPDSQRVRMSLPYYREFGWEPVVLAVRPECTTETLEPSLLSTIPEDVEVIHCGAFPLRAARLFGLGNLGLRAWFHLFLAGCRALRSRKFDAVFFSTTQFATFPLGRIWRRLYGVPYVIDLQDPWRTDYYERPGVRRPPGGWKYQFARLQARLLEEWSFRRVGAFMSVSAQYLFELRRRYAWFARVPSEPIHFGVSENDLNFARGLCFPGKPTPGTGPGTRPRSTVRFVYTGAAGPITPHAVTALLRAVKSLREQQPDLGARLGFEFLGTSYASGDAAKPSIAPIAESLGLADCVKEVPQRLGHLDALRVQLEADVLLLLGSTDLAYSPSKIYPYYLSDRPILSLVFRNSCLESILRELNCSTLVTIEESGASGDAETALHDYFRRAILKPSELHPRRNDERFRREYLARTLTGKQAALFDAASRSLDAAAPL